MRFLSLVSFAVFAIQQIGYASIVYTDSTGDVAVPGNPFPHLDIQQVTVFNTATDISFAIQVNTAALNSPNWGKYMVGINSAAGGTNTGNGWGRPINLTGMDHWIGSWVDNTTGQQNWSFSGSWVEGSTVTPTISGNTLTLTRSLASIGVSAGSVISFDVYSSGGGGGDGAVDALSASSASISDWGNSFSSAGLSYTITAVPEPSSMALVAIAFTGCAYRAFRRKLIS